jgi:hypothetical protein
MWHLHLLRHITRGRREASSSASLRFYKRRIRRQGQVIIRPGLHVSPGTSHTWEMRVVEIQPPPKKMKWIDHWNNSEWISVVLFYPHYFIIIRLGKFSVFAFQMTGVPYTIRLFFFFFTEYTYPTVASVGRAATCNPDGNARSLVTDH